MPEKEEKSLFLQKLEEEERALRSGKGSRPSPPRSHSKRGKKQKTKHKKRTFPAVAIFATVFLVFLIFIAVLIFAMSIGGAENPAIQFFGQNEATLKQFLLKVVNGSLGFLSIVLLLIITTTLFFGFSQPKSEYQKRRTSFIFSIVSVVLQFATVIAWIGMYDFVSALQTGPEKVQANILMYVRENGQLKKIQPKETQDMSTPLVIQFSLEEIVNTIPKNSIKEYLWDYDGDGSIDERNKNIRVERKIEYYGKHELFVHIVLTDETKITKKVTFHIPEGTFSAYPEKGPVPLNVTFDATDISQSFNTSIAQYEWDFDNDYIYEDITHKPVNTHEFKKIGTYTINLRILDQNRTLQTYSRTITTTKKREGAIKPIIKTLPEMTDISRKRIDIFQKTKVTFNASDTRSSDGKITSYEWIFSDTSITKIGPVASRTFTNNGEIEVILRLRDEIGNTAEETVYITVSPKPNAPEISVDTVPKSVDGTIAGTVPLTVTFDTSKTFDKDNDIISYEWDFDNDGNIDATGQNAKHTYKIVGDYNATLAVKDRTGQQETKDFPIVVKNHELRAVIQAEPEHAFVPCVIELDGSLSSCGNCNILAYEWDFGDGNTSGVTSAVQTHPYNQVGVFPVTLTVHSENTSAKTVKNVFCLETQIDACFTSSKLRGRAPFKTVFNPDCTTGTVENWHWKFGDGAISTDRIPSHVYNKSGTYEVTLTVTDGNQSIDTHTLKIFVE
jgi:PKD repeat protein